MQLPFSNSRQDLSQLKTVYYFLIGFQLIVLSLLSINPKQQTTLIDSIIHFIVPPLFFGLVIGGLYYYSIRKRKFLKKVNDVTLGDKEQEYFTATFRKFIFFTAANCLALFALNITQNGMYLLLIGLGILFFLLSFPSLKKFSKDFSITDEELKYLERSDKKHQQIQYTNVKNRSWKFISVFVLALVFGLIFFFVKEKYVTRKISDEEKAALIQRCIKETGLEGYYPEETKSYCQCTNEKILGTFSYGEIMENEKLPGDKKALKYKNITDSCFAQHFGKILEKK